MDRFGVGLGTAGLLVSAYSLTGSLLQPFAGLVADRVDRRLLAALGPVLVALGMGSMGLWPRFEALLFVLALAGVGSALFHASGASLVGEYAPTERRASGFPSSAPRGTWGFPWGPSWPCTWRGGGASGPSSGSPPGPPPRPRPPPPAPGAPRGEARGLPGLPARLPGGRGAALGDGHPAEPGLPQLLHHPALLVRHQGPSRRVHGPLPLHLQPLRHLGHPRRRDLVGPAGAEGGLGGHPHPGPAPLPGPPLLPRGKPFVPPPPCRHRGPDERGDPRGRGPGPGAGAGADGHGLGPPHGVHLGLRRPLLRPHRAAH